MSTPSGEPAISWDEAKSFTAQATPLRGRQVMGGVLAVPFAVAGMALLAASFYNVVRGNHHKAVEAFTTSAAMWLASAVVIRVHIALGWRVVDELHVDFTTRALRIAQRRFGGPRE